MATSKLFTYDLNFSSAIPQETLRKIFSSAISIYICLRKKSYHYEYTFSDALPENPEEVPTLYLSRFQASPAYRNEFVDDESPEMAIPLKTLGWNYKVMVKTFEEIHEDYAKWMERETFLDYTKTITLLEKAGIVKTLETRSFMASDKRKFYFTDDPDGENSAIDVDCLGTSIVQGITQKVLAAFETLDKRT